MMSSSEMEPFLKVFGSCRNAKKTKLNELNLSLNDLIMQTGLIWTE